MYELFSSNLTDENTKSTQDKWTIAPNHSSYRHSTMCHVTQVNAIAVVAFMLSHLSRMAASPVYTNPIIKAVVVGCDHGASSLKDVVIQHLKSQGLKVTDVGTYNNERVWNDASPTSWYSVTTQISQRKCVLAFLVVNMVCIVYMGWMWMYYIVISCAWWSVII